jgi:Domain of Unknown Function (DUF928)
MLQIHKIKLAIAFSLASLVFAPVQAQPTFNYNKQLNQPLVFNAPPPPSDIGAPGTRTGGGKRSTCPDVNKSLIALAPNYSDSNLVIGLTTAEHPTLWFYVPHQPPYTAKFVLRSADGKSVVYQTDVPLPEKAGVVSLQMPSSAPALEIGKQYRWYFKIYCGEPQEILTFVDGWVQRVAPKPGLQAQLEQATPRDRVTLYANNGIWYEAVTNLAKLRRNSPQDAGLSTDWANLLQSVGLAEIAPEPIVDCCQPQINN